MADSDADITRDTPGLRPNRACRNCVQIKAKCVPLQNSNLGICQRCHRLQKPCSTAAPAVKKRSKEEHTGSSNRVTQLEKRLDEVTALLTAFQKDASSSTSNTAAFPTPASLQPPTPQAIHPPPNLFCDHPLSLEPTQPQTTQFSLIPQPDVNLEETLLKEFCTGQTYFWPLVIIPSTTSPSTLRNTRPNLYRSCIFAGARRYPIWQRQLAEGILRNIAETMLISGERSLDLLQGILVFLPWYHYHGHFNAQLMNLIHLAMSLIIDLGLDSCAAVQTQPEVVVNSLATDAERIIHGKAGAKGVKTNEERRAVLAIYYLTSTYSFCFHSLDYLKFSPHLDQCCKDLSTYGEYKTDQIAVAVIRLHHLIERYLAHLDNKPPLPLQLYVKMYRQDLRAYLSTLSDTTTSDEFFNLHLLGAEVTFYESIIHLPTSQTGTIDKVEALHSGLIAVQTYFSSFLAQYSTTMPSIPYFYWMRIIHALGVLTKLSFLQLEGWDLQYVRSTVPFCDLIDRLNAKLWQVQEAEAAEFQIAFSKRFRFYRAKMDKLKFWFNEIMAQEERKKAQDADAALMSFDPNDPMFQGMLDEYLGFDFNEGWPMNA